MARKRAAETQLGEGHDDVIAWYRERLDEPPVFPWVGSEWQPVTLGPTWRVDGGRWLLPDATLGWDVLGWCGTELQHGIGDPWRFTLEQARFVLWWYAVDELGRWLFRDGVLQRLKGWGKDPVVACLSYVEALGPCRVAYMDGDVPVATDCPTAWVQLPAVSLEQTKNTMRLMPGLITPMARSHYGVQVGKELIHAMGDERLIQAVTSSPTTLEGARATAVFPNETQHWRSNNEGHDMAAVLERNATKSPDGAARRLAITNAYEPSEDSVAQRDREAWEKADSGGSLTTGILYDSLEAPPAAPLSAEAAPEVVRAIRGDSFWLDPNRIVQSILDTRNPPSRSRRYWYNQIVAAEDAWVVPQDFDRCAAPEVVVSPSDEIVVFFDGSKSDDATALVGCRVADGHVLTFGMWQRPHGLTADERWTVPRSEVDLAVREIFEAHRVVALWADPSHALDDVTDERYWEPLVDEWHRRWGADLELWAQPGARGHACLWDMASQERVKKFTVAAEVTATEITRGELTHDGDARLRRHVHNARRYPNRFGVSLWKGHRESSRKVDLAVAMVGARMVRRLVQNMARKPERSGVIW